MGNPNSANIRINNQKFRALIDSRADTCLMHSKVYNSLKGVPKLSKKKACLQMVKGDPIKVHGSVSIKFQIGNEKLEYLCHLLREMNNNIILGRDWLLKFGVMEYWDIQCVNIGKSYISLVEGIHINSVVYLASQVIMKLQSVSCALAKMKIADKTSLRKNLCQVYGADKTGIRKEPGLMITNSVIKLSKNQRFSLMITNSTNKMIKLNRGCVVAKIEPKEECNLTTTLPGKVSINKPPDYDMLRKNIIVDDKHTQNVEQLIKDNIDLFAEKDTDLGCTDTITMSIDTGSHSPIKQKPYHAPLTKRKNVDDAIDDMV